ncbi:snf2 family helicase [Ophiostoma piceae UAMH 11346]|uniref:Snf2 family helicase n=1 Tax=Ophiostoma piceae (strain UAMH 11346) TaxID=1262450 RepID=S3BY33_OPHP1|nr:snf2 family helicase [Ophiostoma piceae UAMH 11346]
MNAVDVAQNLGPPNPWTEGDTEYVPGANVDELDNENDSDARFVKSELLLGKSQKGRCAPLTSPSAVQIAANYRGASLVSLDLNYAALLARYRRRKGAFLGVSDATSIRQEEGGGGISWLFERTSTGGFAELAPIGRVERVNFICQPSPSFAQLVSIAIDLYLQKRRFIVMADQVFAAE